MKSLLWKEAFNIPKDSEHSLLEILRSGFINEDDYILWASQAYQLPVVEHDFFKTIKNHKLLLENPSPLWNETFFPAHEWDNALFIVCLEPQEIQIDKPHFFVLASLFRMETLWNKMEKVAKASLQPTKVENTIAIENKTELEKSLLSPDFSFDSIVQKSPELSETPAAESVVNFDTEKTADIAITPPVFSDEATPEVPNFSSLADTPTQPEEPPASFAVDDRTEVLQPAEPQASAPATATSTENVYEESKITSLFSQADSSAQISIPDFIIDELTKEVPLPPPEPIRDFYPPPEQTVIQPIHKEITFTNTKTILPFPERSTQFSFLRTVFSEQVILEARGKVKENTDPHQALICAFHILKDYYKKLMWAVRDQKGAVYPIASNSTWDFSEEAWNTPIDFKSPNPFRIAKFTAKPYHGEVYPNPINDRFFQLWNSGKYPTVFSIVPVRMQGKVFAYFVGCDPAMHYHPNNSLEIMQATCDELIQTFVAIHKELTPPSKAS